MGISSRAAKMIERGLNPSDKTKKAIDDLFRKSNAELEEMRLKKSPDTMIGQQVRNELDRRYENKMAKKGDVDSEYKEFEFNLPRGGKKTPKAEKAADKDAETFAMGKEAPKKKPVKNLSADEKKAAQESLKFKKGGMVTKKKTTPKAKTPAAPSRSNPLNKFYGK